MRSVECSYDTPPDSPPATPDVVVQTQSPSVPNVHSDNARPGLPPRRHIELELLHHYMTETYKTVAQGTQQATLSKLLVDFPLLALRHSELLDLIFSLTAFHIASSRPESASLWSELGLQYKNRALGLLRQSMISITAQHDQQKIEALFASSILIAITTFVSMKKDAASFVEILKAGGQLSIGTVMLQDYRVEEIMRTEMTTLSCETLDESIIDEGVVEAFRRLRALASSRDDSDGLRAGCVNSLWTCFEFCARGWYVTGGSAYGALYQYSQLVERAPQDQFTQCVALVISVLMHFINGRWWAADLGRLGFIEVSASEPLQNSEDCVSLVNWARRRVGL